MILANSHGYFPLLSNLKLPPSSCNFQKHVEKLFEHKIKAINLPGGVNFVPLIPSWPNKESLTESLVLILINNKGQLKENTIILLKLDYLY